MRFHKILCAVDFSATSNEAMCFAADLVREMDAELVVAHVWQPPYIYGPDSAFPSDFFADSKRRAEHDLGVWRASAEHLGARRVAVALLSGNPWHELVELVKRDPRIDLIVMGTHGRTGLKHALVGSVAEKVVRHAPCPVLVTRKREGALL